MTKKQTKFTNAAIAIIICIIITVLITVIIALNNNHEEYKTTSNREQELSLLVCSASSLPNSFFTSSAGTSKKHEVKITFLNGEADKISYTFEGSYNDADAANTESTTMHAQYNKFMSAQNLDINTLSNNFSVYDNTSKITLFADIEKIPPSVSKLFLINTNRIGSIANSSIHDFRKMYSEEGLTCSAKQ